MKTGKRILLLAMLALMQSVVVAQVTYNWAMSIGVANIDAGSAVVTDASGNIYVAGVFQGTTNFNPLGTSTNVNGNATAPEAFVAKYNSSGILQRAFRMGSNAGTERSLGIALDASGNVYVTGFATNNSANFDPLFSVPGTVACGSGKCFIAKYNSNLDYIKAIAIGNTTGSTQDLGNDITIDGSGNVYVTGSFTGTANFNPAGSAPLTSAGTSDIFIAKYDSDLLYINAIGIGSTGNEQGYGIDTDASGNVYVTGVFTGTNVNFNPAGTAINLTDYGSGDIFIGKYNSSLVAQWVYGVGTGLVDEGRDVEVTSTGDVYLVGSYSTDVIKPNFDPVTSTPSAELTGLGDKDGFITKYSTAGTYQWATRIGGTAADQAIRVCLDGSNIPYVTGGISNAISGTSTYDVFFNKYNTSTGVALLSNQILGGANIESGAAITVDASNNIILTGAYISNPCDMDPGAGTQNLTGAGTFPFSDIFISRYTQCIPPTIGTQPNATSACVGGNASFTVAATGTGSLTYQWRKGGSNISNGGSISGATSATLTITGVVAGDAANYDCVISGACLPTATSNAVALTINTAPSITGQPSATSACVSGNASFSVTATGTGLTYQWRKGGSNISNGGSISGATSATLTITGVVAGDAGNYDCVVSGTCTPAATSNAVALTINTAPSITGQPSATSACVSGNASFSVTATGTGLTYQWRKGGSNISNGGSISGATSATLTITGVVAGDAANYDCVVSGSCTPAATSNAVALTINTAPSITGQPSATSACVSGNASFTVTATGTGLTYQWRKGGSNISNGGTISGATSATLTITGVVAGDAANYDCVVSGSCTPAATSNAVALTVNTAPSITGQPSATSACVSGNASFSVTATGTGLTYQWRKGGSNLSNGGTISGATSATLTITGVVAGDAANYDCVVSGSCTPAATSNAVALTVNTAPSITGQPSASAVCSGSNASFTVTATGAGLTYQWRRNGSNLSNGGSISGATSATITITGALAANAGNYDCVVSGTCSPSATSNAVALTINTAPSITGQPSASSVCSGGTATFSVTATGTGLTYQWRKGGSNISNGGSISGATSATLTITGVVAGDAANYDCVVSGSCTPAATSNAVALTVNTAPSITGQPSASSLCSGATATFTVTATGTGLTYQWRKGGSNISNGGTISGATSATLTITGVVAGDAANYDCVVSGTCTPAATSNAVALTVNTAPSIGTQPSPSAVCSGGTATFTVAATGTGLTYQWRKGSTSLTNTGNISGATSATLTISSVSAGDVAANYNCVISGTCTPSVTTNNVALSITSGATVTTQPSNQTVCPGATTTFTVVAGGSGLTYQWKQGVTSLSDGGDISGATTATLSIANTSAGDAGSYSVEITATCGAPVTSNTVTLALNTTPSITGQPSATSACVGGNASFTVTATGTGVTYQWRKGGSNISNGGSISGATSATLTITGVIAGDAANYDCVVSGTCTPSVTSNAVALTVNTAPSIGTQPSASSVCSGATATFTVVASGSGLTYQWRKGSTNLTDGGNISGATTATLSISSVSAGDVASNYNCVVSGTCTPSVTSNNVALSITTGASITTHPTSQSICEGNSVTFTVASTGSGLTYQWRKNGVDIGPATSSSYTIPAVAVGDAASYTVIVTASCGSPAISNPGILSVNTAPSISVQPSTQTLCEGAPLSLSVTAAGTGLTYQWKLDGNDIATATSSTYNAAGGASASNAGSYTVVITGTCGSPLTSNAAVITVNSLPAITTQPVNASVCSAGQTATFTVVATGTGVTYVWKKNGTTLTNGGNIAGATSSTLVISSVSVSDVDNYSVSVSGTCTPPVNSNSVALSINSSATVINTQPSSQSLCVGDNLSLAVTATGSSLTYQWKKDGISLSNGGNISGATTSNLTITNLSLTDDADYTCDISSSCNPLVSSNAAVITVTVCTGTSDALAADMVLSPNPTNGYFTLDAEAMQDGSISIVITNSLGTEVWRGNEYVSGGELHWSGDISELTAGVYHVQIVSGDKIMSRRIVKK